MLPQSGRIRKTLFMSSNYPSLVRTRKAFDNGYFGITGHNPYKHPKLRELWERGKKKAAERILSGLGPPVRPKPLRKVNPNQRPRPERFRSQGRSGGGRYGSSSSSSSDSPFRRRPPRGF